MSEPLCLAPLLSALREAGLAVGFAEQARLKHIFRLAPSGADEARLRSLLRAVLVKSEDDIAPFDRVYDAWLQEAESALQHKRFTAGAPLAPTAPEPGPATGRMPDPSRAPEWLAVAAVCLAAAVAIWLVAFPPSEVKTAPAAGQQPEAAKPVPPASGTLVETPRDTFRTVRPQVTITPVQPQWQGWRDAALGGLALLATALAYWQFRRRRWLPEQEPGPSRQGPPRVWVEWSDAGPLLLGPDDQQALVWGIGHFVSETPTRRLDLAATVRATARAGGFPSIHFLTARHQREVWLWLDESAEDPNLGRLAEEITALLPAYGLAVERASFWGLPETLSTPQGQRFAPKEVEERSAVALVAVLTDGRLLLRQYEADDRRPHADALLRTLSHWPHLWFVDPGESASGLAAVLARFGIACFHPRELPARLTGGHTVVRNGAASATDERLWAAACALSPAPVSETLAAALHRHLRLSATPWALARLRRQAPGPAARLQWRARDRADRINWLVACQVQPGDDGGNSIFAQALAFWEQALATEYDRRHRAAPETWKDLPAERQLRMERHLLALWRNPKAAITGLYPLFQGALKEPIREQLAALAPRDRGGRYHIRLPWRWEACSGPEQHMLLEMGFCAGALEAVRLRRPGRFWLGLSLGAGLGVGALVLAAAQPWVVPAPEIPPVLTHRGEKPAASKASILAAENGRWPVRISTPKWLLEEAAPPAAAVDIFWSAADAPCREDLDGAEIWRCGARTEVTPAQPEQHRRLVVLVAQPEQAKPLAVRLLDSGNADQVLIDPAWPRSRARLLGAGTAGIGPDEHLLIVRESEPPPPGESAATPGAVEIAAAPDSWQTLAKALNFAGTPAAAKVWPAAQVLAGDFETLVFAGLSACPREVADSRSGLTFVELCGGTFTMGSPPTERDRENDEVQHQVTLSPFAIGKTEVTNAQYRRFKPNHKADNDKPVVEVSWTEAKAFCENYGYRLPTEAQWEYAARAGTTTRWSFGDDEARLADHAWFGEGFDGSAHAVGQKKPNAWDLYDMHGNVWEWVADWYGDYPTTPQTDPAGPNTGQYRVLRGGAFFIVPRDLRSAGRFGDRPEDRFRDVGFRCARAPAASLAP